MRILKPLTLFISTLYLAQTTPGKVGINTNTPRQTLDVNGTTYADKIYLHKAETATTTGGQYIATDTNNSIKQIGAGNSLFNYIPVTFTKVPASGISEFDTGIKHNEFVVVLHNYSVTTQNNSPSVGILHNDTTFGIWTDTIYQGSPEFIVYKKTGSPNWWLRARFKDSKFVNMDNNTAAGNKDFNIKVYLIAYRKIITKQNIADQATNLGTSNSIPKPIGF